MENEDTNNITVTATNEAGTGASVSADVTYTPEQPTEPTFRLRPNTHSNIVRPMAKRRLSTSGTVSAKRLDRNSNR
ncbi:hypothetical protein [Shewanella atlantica]|uniref:hypothetical protein n=1 Tax=Shewanella atlantica TaxID=271099 RepID=UPI003735DCF5